MAHPGRQDTGDGDTWGRAEIGIAVHPSYGVPMIRFGNVLLLIGLGASLCGCGSRYEAVRAQVQQLQRVNHEPSPERPVATQRTQPAALTTAGDATGSIVRSNDSRPWPKRGTPEYDQLQAEEVAREQRIKEVLSSICSGC
jgi:hypothetical protein